MIPYRKVVPAGYHTATLTLTGTSALLMNSGEVDRESDQYRAFVQLSQKSKKSLDDEARLREMEWALRLYLDEEVGPFIPGKNVKEMLRSAATKWRRGEDVKRSLIVVQHRIPLLYDGPRDQQGLWDKGYRYTAMVANAGISRGRVVRCRPCFETWALEVELAWDAEDLDYDFLQIIVERSRKFGLGDYRPEFGSFLCCLGPSEIFKDGAATDAQKELEALASQAHAASVKRIQNGDDDICEDDDPPIKAKVKASK